MNIRKISIIFLTIMLLLFVPTIVMAKSDVIVMLDPGHGGSEVGAIRGNYVEKDINWKIAKRVKEILDNTSGITGILTRGENEYVSIEDRGLRARDNNADFLVSFHINSTNADATSVSGAEVYITADTNQRRYYEYSNKLGLDILSELRNVGVRSNNYKPMVKYSTDGELYADGFLSDWYGIIRHPMYYDIPGILIEHCYINNPSDRANYLNDSKLNEIAMADAKAIIKNKELFRKSYYGKIESNLESIELIKGSNGDNYISGYIEISEIIDGEVNTPKDAPLLTLKSTDGTFSKKIYSSNIGGNRYYFDTDMDLVDPNKEYYIESYLTSERNMETTSNKTQKVELPNIQLGQIKKGTISIDSNTLKIKYEGEVNTQIKETNVIDSNGKKYLTGNVKAEEIIGNTTYGISSINNINFYITSTDGAYTKKMFSYYMGDNVFYFDTIIDNLDKSKTYNVVAEVINPNNVTNISKKKKNVILGENKIIGNFDELHIKTQADGFIITDEYQAEIKVNQASISLEANNQGRHYICGYMKITEKANNQEKIPVNKPTLTLRTDEGAYVQNMYISYIGDGTYYYDTYVEDLDKSKQYCIEAKLADTNNAARDTQKSTIIQLADKELGKLNNNYKVVVEDGKIKYIDSSKYLGIISAELESAISLDENVKTSRHYIYGYLKIFENVSGQLKVPESKPSLTLKSTDGTYSQNMYIYHEGNGKYYFDTYIEELDLSKQYYIEAKLTDGNNIAQNSQKTKTLEMPTKELGTLSDKKVVIKNSRLQFENIVYTGIISTSLENISLDENVKTSRHYICGYLKITENVDGFVQIPKNKPTLTLKSTDGTYSQNMYIYHEGNGRYYFDTYIEELDLSKQYYIEARLVDGNNMASESQKTSRVSLPNVQLGTMKHGSIVVELINNRMVFK